MDYELYHDESKYNGYWHGMLLIPVRNKEYMLSLLEKARVLTNYNAYVSYKNIRKFGANFECQRVWSELATLGLRSKLGNSPEYVDWGRKVSKEGRYEKINQLIGLKFILFREIDQFKNMSPLLDLGGKVEVTFRMGLKGGLHYLGSEENPINILKIHFDGYQHYHRRINRERIIGRLNGLRPYVSIVDRNDLIDDRSSKFNQSDSQPEGDCELLQFTDVVIGGLKAGLIGQGNRYKRRVSYSLISLVDRYKKGPARMKNSRWVDSLCISQCYLTSNQWKFETIYFEDNNQPQQLSFEFND